MRRVRSYAESTLKEKNHVFGFVQCLTTDKKINVVGCNFSEAAVPEALQAITITL